MEIRQNITLKPFTSMYVGGVARYFVEVFSQADLRDAISFAKANSLKVFILGGGSNILVSDRGFSGLVIRVCIKAIRLLDETVDSVLVNVGAGEGWDDFVKYAVDKNLYGIENMSHIPGTVGASVVQNIGCYGQEVSTSIESVEVVSLEDLTSVTFSYSEMEFGYRKSILNDITKKKNKYVVTSVNFRLSKIKKFNLTYDDVSNYFNRNQNKEINLENIRIAIIQIRDKKYPFPGLPENGTAGSFWNSEVVTEEVYENIIKKLIEKGFKEKAEVMLKKKSVFTVRQGLKVPYGMLIEVLGFKGRKVGGATVLESHSGVINNFSGSASSEDILSLSKMVIDTVWNEFGVRLKMEPEIVGE